MTHNHGSHPRTEYASSAWGSLRILGGACFVFATTACGADGMDSNGARADSEPLAVSAEQFAQRPGTYHVRETAQFVALLRRHPNATFVIERDLDLSGVEPFDEFGGTLEGQGHSLSNFSYLSNVDEDGAGLFRTLTGTVHDLALQNCRIRSRARHVGCLAGTLFGSVIHVGVVSGHVGCTGDVNVNLAWACGGLIGGLWDTGVVERDFSLVSVDGGNVYAVGGLVGGEPNGGGGNVMTISNSYATGRVSGAWLAGGLTGGLGGGGSQVNISDSHAYGRVRIENELQEGGLLGRGDISVCTSSYYNGDRNASSACGDPLTSVEFRDPSHFVGWDFETVWQMGPRYPVLRAL